MASTVVEEVSELIQAEISPGLQESLPATDGIFEQIRASSMGVNRGKGVGRDYKVLHNFSASLAGAFKFVSSPFGSATLETVLPAHVLSTLSAFQGSGEATSMGTVQRTLSLVQGNGNFFLPVQLFQVDQLDATTVKYVAENIKAVAKLVAHLNAVSFYAVPVLGTQKPLAVIPASGATITGGSDGDGYVIIEFGSSWTNGRIRNFYPGMFVDFLTDDGNAYTSLVDSSAYMVVTEVDYLNKIITVKSTASTTNDFTADVLAGDMIIPKDCGATTVGYGPSGIESWTKAADSGGSADVEVFGVKVSGATATEVEYPQFGSLVAAVSGSLTESVLNKYVGSFMDAYGKKLDTFITTGGVVREMLDQVEDLGVFQRQGAALNMENGWTDIGYQYNGQKFKWLLSTYCSPGYLYGLKTGEGNLTRYIPPNVSGMGTHDAFGGDVQFISKWAGSTGIFKPLHNDSGNTTEVLEAPFMTLHEIAPTDVQGIKLTGLTELNA